MVRHSEAGQEIMVLDMQLWQTAALVARSASFPVAETTPQQGEKEPCADSSNPYLVPPSLGLRQAAHVGQKQAYNC